MDANKKISVIIRPFTLEEVFSKTKGGSQHIVFVILVELDEITKPNKSAHCTRLNHIANERLGHLLEDFSYKILKVDFDNHGNSTNKIFIECSGNPVEAIKDYCRLNAD